ncbi:MAG TPA: DUF1329 domain-containing protein [Candidatus Binataceae bacterium]|nr:DUF1329 domain-containing protein [Candidatus Binataceae bacterium]
MPKSDGPWIWPGASAAIALLTALMFLAEPAQAQVKPGDFITPENGYKVKEVVSPGVYYKVENGMTMKIVPSEQINWPPPYRDATEKYADQVRLSPDGRTVVNYVAGQPFPFLDPNDPQIATKIMWNNAFRPITSDDYDLRFYDCDVTYTGRNRPIRVIDYFQIGHYAGYDEVGRTEVEPMPIDPDYKQTNRYWMFALYPILAPEDLYGSGFIRFRYENPKRGDDIWQWVPGGRRLRRLNEGIMGDAIAGGGSSGGAAGGPGIEMSDPVTFDPNHYSGFNAKIEEYNYKFLGQKTMLASVNAAHSPEITCQTDGGGSACPENWEMRPLYVVQTTPRWNANNPQALHSKSILYIDSEMWFEPYVDEYDAKGELWQNHIYWLTYRDRPVPDARVAIYPFRRAFVVGASSTDVQSGLATMCYLPGQNTPERECWYINMGAVGRDFFTTQSMVKAAP